MRIQVLGCAGGSAPARQLTSFQIDDDFVVDAGAITTALEIPDQRKLKAMVMTHSHMDHVWSLPLFLSNRFVPGLPPCPIYGSAPALQAIHGDLFNGRIWPDFAVVPHEGKPMLELHPVDEDAAFNVGDYRLTPFEMDHTVACRGYVIDNADDAFIIAGDTGPTQALWRVANQTTKLRGLIVECSFPDRLGSLAVSSKHLTPTTLGTELRKLTADVPVYITHMKPGYEDELREGIASLGDDRIHILESGQVITT